MTWRALRSWRRAGLAGTAAGAHNFHMGIADISYNAPTGNTEIVHTYTSHDVSTLLTNLYGRSFDLGQADSEQPLRRYVEKQFHLAGPDNKRLPLQWVGVKADADSVVIFQEIAGTRLKPGTRIHNPLLIDFLPAKEHSEPANRGAIQTLIFDHSILNCRQLSGGSPLPLPMARDLPLLLATLFCHRTAHADDLLQRVLIDGSRANQLGVADAASAGSVSQKELALAPSTGPANCSKRCPG